MTNTEFIKESLKQDRSSYIPIVERLYESTDPLSLDINLTRIIHASIGMSGETGEILDTVKKSMMYGKELDTSNLKEECGDVLWYMAIMLHELGSSFEEVMKLNVDKLSKRYPNGFTEADAIARKDKNEIK